MYIYKCDKVVDIILHNNTINKLTKHNNGKLIRLSLTVKNFNGIQVDYWTCHLLCPHFLRGDKLVHICGVRNHYYVGNMLVLR